MNSTETIQDTTPETTEDAELRASMLYSDLHKDFYGRRPRTEGMTVKELAAGYNRIMQEMNELKKTKEGRESLRQNGWTVEEPA